MSSLPWSEDRLVPDGRNAHGLSFSPAAAVFNSRIYIVHQGRGNDGRLWYTTFDGSRWTPDTPLPAGGANGIKGSPSVAVHDNKLYIAYRGQDDRLRLGWLDANGFFGVDATTYRLSYSPAMVAFGGRLFLVYQGTDDKAGTLVYTRTNGRDWDAETTITDLGCTGSPALTVYQNKVHCFFKGTNKSLDLNNILLFDTLCERMGVTDPWVQMVMECMLGVAEAVTPMGDVKMVAQTAVALSELVHLASARQSDWVWHTTFADGRWETDVLCPSAEDAYGVNSESSAAVVYANCLFNIRQGRDGSKLWCGLYNGDQWLKDQEVRTSGGTAQTTGAPALVVFNDTLYCFHQGRDDSGWMWMTTLSIPRPPNVPTRRVSLQSVFGGYVAAELGQPDLKLTATRGAVGGWETFTLLELGNGRVALRAANNRYVCAELGMPWAPLTATRNAVGGWETFQLHERPGGRVALQAANGMMVRADLTRGLQLMAGGPPMPGAEDFVLRNL